MKILDLPLLSSEQILEDRPVVLTIGNFDGLHLGHQKVLQRVVEVAKSQNAIPSVLTFHNHPAEILRPHLKLCRILSLPLKMKLFGEEGIVLTTLLRFTKEISELSPEEFLRHLRRLIPFKHLILGYDSSFGKDKTGTKDVVRPLAEELNFTVEYLEPYYDHDKIISSSLVRSNLQAGKLEEVSKLMGREYSILSHVSTGMGHGKKIGYPTANVDVTGLCLPPTGVYAVRVKYEGKLLNGIANLGVAPTLREDNKPVLEVHLFDHQEEIYDKVIEVFFKGFIREERRFENVELLKEQIAKDIIAAKNLF